MALERIQKVMAEQGLCSRRAAEQIILEGRVKLNGHPVRLGDKMDVNRDVLMIDGERIRLVKKQEYHYLMLHKPRGFVTTTSDERGRKTVMDLLADYPVRVFPVGRLDKDSEGLLLLTNDGGFANLMMHPSHGVSKLYRVTVHPRADESQVVALSKGVTLDDGTVTQPAVVNVVVDEPGRTVLEMTIKEGKNRQIRRMCEAVGLEVVRLRRQCLVPRVRPHRRHRVVRMEDLHACRHRHHEGHPHFLEDRPPPRAPRGQHNRHALHNASQYTTRPPPARRTRARGNRHTHRAAKTPCQVDGMK